MHKSGFVGCFENALRTNWGCESQAILIAITDDKNEIIFPINLDNEGRYNHSSYISTSQEIIFNISAKSTQVIEGKIMRLWYGEDLRNYGEENNFGESCADVYTQTSGMFT